MNNNVTKPNTYANTTPIRTCLLSFIPKSNAGHMNISDVWERLSRFLSENKRLEIVYDFVKEKNAYIEEYESKISSLDSQIKNLTKKQKELIDDYTSQINENTSEISSLKNELSEKISTYEQRIQKIEKDYTLQIEDMTFKNKSEVEELLEKQRNLEGTNTFYLSQIDALRVENGSLSPSLDYVNEQRLDELEREYLIFKKFYKNQWKLAKKELRKMILNKEEITKNNKKQEKAN